MNISKLQTYFIFIVFIHIKLSLYVWMDLVMYIFAHSSPTDNKRPGLYSVSVSQMQLMEDNYVPAAVILLFTIYKSNEYK